MSATGWQPIETAPVDEWVLVRWQHEPTWPMAVLRKTDHGYWIEDRDGPTYETPTHWHRLPGDQP
jgi:hypothetical protein